MTQKINSFQHSKRFPYWLRQSVRFDAGVMETKKLLREAHINTVCQSSRCPNIFDCFSKKRCTFLILGKVCTRSCGFCAIEKQNTPKAHLGGVLLQKHTPEVGFGEKLCPPDKSELLSIRDVVERLGLHSVIITSVTRDDLSDGGAGHFADCVKILRGNGADLEIEALVPDFLGNIESIKKILSKKVDIFAHNIEAVPRLYSKVRPQADYDRSLDVIRSAKSIDNDIVTKSGLMVGFGEKRDEVYSVMLDLKEAGCDIVTIGQYLRPDSSCLKVEEFLHPEEFERFSNWAKDFGFKKFSCSPFTRSSYLE